MKPARFPARSQVSALTALCASLLFALPALPGCGDDDVNPTPEEEVDASTGNAQTPGNMDGGSSSPGNNGNNGNNGNGGPGRPTNIDAATPGSSGDAAASSDANTGNASSDGSVAREDAGPIGSLDASTDASVPVADAGGRRCGTRGGVRCGEGQFCNFEPDTQCGATDRGGMCEAEPEVCPTIYQPVCGCDNRTYPSACNAHSRGISVKAQGECPPRGGRPDAGTGMGGAALGQMCGGIAGIACVTGAFCNLEPANGYGCGPVADAAGTCEAEPRGCPRNYAPVCGCDHRTYSNECVAHQAGVSIARGDACTEVDCAAIGGEVVTGIGPGPMCPAGTQSAGPVRFSNGQIPIEGALCCVRP